MSPANILEALIYILMAFGVVFGLGFLFVQAIMKGFAMYMNRRPPRGW